MAFYANYGRGGKRMKQIVTCKEMKALDGNMDAISNFSELTENLNLRDRQNGKLYFRI